MPTISFIIPVRNDAERLGRCLASVTACLSGVDAEIIVADNGSTDQSADVAKAAGAIVVAVPGRGIGEIRNRGAAQARSDILAFVDADHEVAPGWAAAALQAMRDPSISAAGAHYHAPADGTWVQQLYDRLRTRAPGSRPVDWLGSGNLVIRRAAFQAVSGFDTRLDSCEDVDLCQRLRAGGGQILSVEDMISVHHGDPRTLTALFRGELWRGRDNLRVSIRAPLTMRSLPSLVMPVLSLVGLVLIVGGLGSLLLGRDALLVSLVGILALALPIAVHFLLLFSRTAPVDRSWTLAARAWLFSCVHNIARALALVVRASHRTRRAG